MAPDSVHVWPGGILHLSRGPPRQQQRRLLHREEAEVCQVDTQDESTTQSEEEGRHQADIRYFEDLCSADDTLV